MSVEAHSDKSERPQVSVEVHPDQSERPQVSVEVHPDQSRRSLSQWTLSMASMPDGAFPELEQVRTLNYLLFDEGLSFLKLPFRE